MFANRIRMYAGLTVAVLSVAFALSAYAQSTPSDSSRGTNPTPAASSTKMQRKAARKQNHAKKNADLKQLEGAGYNPSRTSPNYPTDVQNAEKKADAASGAHQ